MDYFTLLVYYRFFSFLLALFPSNAPTPLKILDFGSCDVNGKVRSALEVSSLPSQTNITYLGVDQAICASNVDMTIKAYPEPFPFEDESFDVIVSAHAFEHDPFYWETFLQFVRVLKPGGFIILVTPSEWEYHAYPVDNVRFMADSPLALSQYAAHRGFGTIDVVYSFVWKTRQLKSNRLDFGSLLVAMFHKPNTIEENGAHTVTPTGSIDEVNTNKLSYLISTVQSNFHEKMYKSLCHSQYFNRFHLESLGMSSAACESDESSFGSQFSKTDEAIKERSNLRILNSHTLQISACRVKEFSYPPVPQSSDPNGATKWKGWKDGYPAHHFERFEGSVVDGNLTLPVYWEGAVGNVVQGVFENSCSVNGVNVCNDLSCEYKLVIYLYPSKMKTAEEINEHINNAVHFFIENYLAGLDLGLAFETVVEWYQKANQNRIRNGTGS